ncbi:MAG: hypothetical protein KatS3mg054_0051 [Chloroflexus sp.]|nr:MAG: hypothetical protein KatS3mg054_0051 [Chloroflexus sp.]
MNKRLEEVLQFEEDVSFTWRVEPQQVSPSKEGDTAENSPRQDFAQQIDQPDGPKDGPTYGPKDGPTYGPKDGPVKGPVKSAERVQRNTSADAMDTSEEPESPERADEPTPTEAQGASEQTDDSGDEDPGEGEPVDIEDVNNRLKVVVDILNDYLPLRYEGDLDPESVEGFLEQLPGRMFAEYVEALGPQVRDLLVWAANKRKAGQDISPKELAQFTRKYVDVDVLPDENQIVSEDGARKYLMQHPNFVELYPDEEERTAAIEVLQQKGILMQKAKSLYDKQKEDIERKRAEEVEKAREQAEQQQRMYEEFLKKARRYMEQTPWAVQRSDEIVSNMDPKVIQEKWRQITTMPEAFVQFANLLSYFDGKDFGKLYEMLAKRQQSNEVDEAAKRAKVGLGKYIGTMSTRSKKASLPFEFDY